jgi:hypothetical protein
MYLLLHNCVHGLTFIYYSRLINDFFVLSCLMFTLMLILMFMLTFMFNDVHSGLRPLCLPSE